MGIISNSFFDTNAEYISSILNISCESRIVIDRDHLSDCMHIASFIDNFVLNFGGNFIFRSSPFWCFLLRVFGMLALDMVEQMVRSKKSVMIKLFNF